MLELIEVTKKYKNKIAVDNISFTLQEGEVIGLLGSNGAGKSTTISMIATLLAPEEGKILLDGESIVANPKKMRSVLGYVPQDIALYENLTGMDNLKFWGRSYGLHNQELQHAIQSVVEITRLTDTELKQKVGTYSGGMKRRLNIGVALLHNPKIVVMDEPTVGLDIISRRTIIEAIKEINGRGVSVIYTGHYFEEIEEICSRIIIMDHGRIIVNGTKEELLKEHMNLEQYYLNVIKG